ncbi:ATP-binding protein [Bacillus sp. CCB-MMP212]|uniref:ATP-binding protein n=1 Tax=Bacillus sp. CCB-MMP212 TaxID=2928002 RepID=UPI001F604B28|nr:ATP-binding protein [Bacillus sp. CCB-MMP212]MCI4252776.1 ATP-binding protein [Bacillus sp. CCB-MMP212]
MTTSRNYGEELDFLTQEVKELKQILSQIIGTQSPNKILHIKENKKSESNIESKNELGEIFYSGQYRGQNSIRWDPQQRNVYDLLELDSEKVAKVLSALGNKQRLDILTTVLRGPTTGIAIVEQLNMGTTGQLYHHTKALLGADLLVQEERGGHYSLPTHRIFPLLLLLSALSDLIDTSSYIELTEARNNKMTYLGEEHKGYNPNDLLWAVLENSILEHEEGYCSDIVIVLQGDGSVTVADNGRGIPIKTMPNSINSSVQEVLTELGKNNTSASFIVRGGLKGINMAVVNALSEKLSTEVRREGRVYHQDFKYGIPQSELLVIGITKETGTSVTFKPDQDIFTFSFNKTQLTERINVFKEHYPNLNVQIIDSNNFNK